jgi:hypothetical protein
MSKPELNTTEPSEIHLRLDADHDAALDRIARAENLKRQDTLRRLIRVADRILIGDKSPFPDLQALFSRKAG